MKVPTLLLLLFFRGVCCSDRVRVTPASQLAYGGWAVEMFPLRIIDCLLQVLLYYVLLRAMDFLLKGFIFVSLSVSFEQVWNYLMK